MFVIPPGGNVDAGVESLRSRDLPSSLRPDDFIDILSLSFLSAELTEMTPLLIRTPINLRRPSLLAHQGTLELKISEN